MKQIVVISGKGGTGKTVVTGSLAFLAKNKVMVDCDVDAADLHLVLAPKIIEEHEFVSGHEAVIRQDDCIGCRICQDVCRFDAVRTQQCNNGNILFSIDTVSCEGCGVCVHFCPEKAIDFPERLCGKWFVSKTRYGPMVHARLGVAAENSGKLVSTVRREARRLAEENGAVLVVVLLPTREQVNERSRSGEFLANHDRLLAFLGQEGIPFIDLLGPLREVSSRALGRGAEKAPLYWRTDSHMGPVGDHLVGLHVAHRLIAETFVQIPDREDRLNRLDKAIEDCCANPPRGVGDGKEPL